jgi:ribosomal protein S2
LIGSIFINTGASMRDITESSKDGTKKRLLNNMVKTKCSNGGVLTIIHHQWLTGMMKNTPDLRKNIRVYQHQFSHKVNL